jgi:hypothetical protein
MAWIEMRFNSNSLNSNSIEFRFNWTLIQIPNIQIHGMKFKFHWIRYFDWIWFEIQLDSDSVEEKWDVNWCMRYWKYACHCSVEKNSFQKCRSKKHLAVLFGANTKPKSIFVLMEPKLVYSIQAPMLPSSLELRLTACLTSIMYV